MQHDNGQEEKQHLFDRPQNVKRVIWGLFALCILLIVIDLFLPIHGQFAWEQASGYYAAYGFVACVGLVLAAKHVLRRIVKRDEDYYD